MIPIFGVRCQCRSALQSLHSTSTLWNHSALCTLTRMATLSSALASSINVACFGPAFNCPKRGASAGVSHRIVWTAHLAQCSYFSAQLSGHLLRQASARRKVDIYSDTCKGTRHSLVRAQVKDIGKTPAGSGQEPPPAERTHLESKAEDRKVSLAENERLVAIGEGDDPEASGALSICLDAIGTVSP
jgi:hypothetical protein